MTQDEEGSGLVHLARVDLNAPGIELYVTPLNQAAIESGYQYELAWGGGVLKRERLSVLVNGTLHYSTMRWLPLPGDWANSVETIVADGEINHLDPNSYLLWFDFNLKPTLERVKPPSSAALQFARWGISGQAVAAANGIPSDHLNHQPDARTALGIDPTNKLLWIATYESASEFRAVDFLVEQGAADVVLLDGGDSTMMALGAEAQGVTPGVKQGGWRPVATFFGVRARSLDASSDVSQGEDPATSKRSEP